MVPILPVPQSTPRRRLPSWPGLLLTCLLVVGVPVAAQEAPAGALSGVVVEHETGEPVEGARLALLGSAELLEAVSDPEGAFRFPAVPVGSYAFRVEHLAFGTVTSAVDVASGEETVIRAVISPSAILLEAVEVTVLSQREEEIRARGTRRNEITRDLIMSPGNTQLNLAEIVRKYVPGIQVRNRGAGTTCLEFRGPSSLQRDREGCRSPAVYMDGMPIMAPATLYAQLPPETIERMEFLSPAEAGARYGTGSMFGVLLIESRRPGIAPDRAAEERIRRLEEGYRHDWATETSSHPWVRVLLTAAAANAAGLALGTAAAGSCIQESPRTDGFVSNCGGMATTSMAGIALLIPALSSSLAARYAGSTPDSRGRFTAAATLSALALMPGYGLILSSNADMSSGTAMAGQVLLAVGTPLVVTLADYLFRRRF